MIHVGRVLIDDRAPRVIYRPLEKWERLVRAYAAGELALWVLERREKYGLTVRDLRELDRWADRVYCASHGAVSPAGICDGPITPYDVFDGDSTWQSWHRTDSGISTVTGVSAWLPIKGTSAFNLAQANSGLQPAWTANDAAVHGRGTANADGTDDYFSMSWNPPSTTTQNLYIRAIAKQHGWTAARVLFAGSSNGLHVLRGTGSSPSVGIRNPTAVGSVSMTLNTWFRCEVFFAGGVGSADYVRVGSNASTGLNAGDVDSTGLGVFATNLGTSVGAYSLAEWLTCTANPSTLKRALLDGIDARYYNSAITA